ncbi:MAG TPA: hypothetical protein VD999_04905 [Vitreimonas sp.]|nr:hypothetical protein [Vitreimonas sp.]
MQSPSYGPEGSRQYYINIGHKIYKDSYGEDQETVAILENLRQLLADDNLWYSLNPEQQASVASAIRQMWMYREVGNSAPEAYLDEEDELYDKVMPQPKTPEAPGADWDSMWARLVSTDDDNEGDVDEETYAGFNDLIDQSTVSNERLIFFSLIEAMQAFLIEPKNPGLYQGLLDQSISGDDLDVDNDIRPYGDL